MKRLFSFIIIIGLCFKLVSGQEMDPVFTGTYSGTQIQPGRNSVTLGPDYTYTPSGGTLTVEIQNPIVTGTVAYSPTPIDPETRTLNTSYLVGATKGSFNVDPMGGASYEIPLELLPGVNGLAPSLSLIYSSNNGPGKAGYGWKIGGLSVINRGSQDYYHDGAARGVELDLNDRFYLDGQRLVNTITSNYQDAGGIYRTDDDIFTRISPQAFDGNGPGWFKAETKSGLIYEYGNNTGARQKVSGYSQVVNWYVSSIKDLFNNQINFAYIQDNNSIYPAEITYGPNTITLNYKERSDKTNSYLKGVKIQQNLILDKITVKYNSTIVKTYELKYTYQGSSYNSYSNLNEVVEYGIGSSRYNSTAIIYSLPENVSFSFTNYYSNQYLKYQCNIFSGDFNGDGRTDFISFPYDYSWSGIKVCISDGNNGFSTLNEPYSLGSFVDLKVTDVNGDGRDDILYEVYSAPNYMINCMLSQKGNDPFADPALLYSCTYTSYPDETGLSGKMDRQVAKENESEYTKPGDNTSAVGDYTGDGINDVFINKPNGDWIIKSFGDLSGNLTTSINTLGNGNIATLNKYTYNGDFNGDGKSEIWSFEDDRLRIYSFNAGTLNLIYETSSVSNQHYFSIGDFNGDGMVDVFVYGDHINGISHDYYFWTILKSTGVLFESTSFIQKKANLKADFVRVSDFNGDGYSDIMVTNPLNAWQGVYYYISKNIGNDFDVNYFPYIDISNKLNIGDFNGDQNNDCLVRTSGTDGYKIYKSSTLNSILLNKVGNGLGELNKAFFLRISQSNTGFYNKGKGAAFPLVDFQGTLSVISSVQLDNGKGTLNTRNYSYDSSKVHIQGKGFLGFSNMKMTDVAAAIDNRITINGFDPIYFFPQVTKSYSLRTGTTDTLSVTKNILDKIVFDIQKKWIYSFIKKSIQSDKLMGHILTHNYQYNSYGNPTIVSKIYSNGPTETTTNDYNDEKVSSSQWLIGRPTTSSITHTQGQENITRYVARIFSPTSNFLTSETWHSGTNQQIAKSFIPNTNGTISSETATANSVSRTTSYTYKADNIRINTVTDPLSHVTTNNYDNYGRLYTRSDYLNNTVTYQYDNMGRESVVSSTFGDQKTTTFAWETPTSVPKPARYSILQTGNEGSQTKSWFDKLGREIRSDVKGFGGTWIYTATKYNLKGQVDSISDPYYSNGSPLWNRYIYDSYGRTTNLNRPSGRNSTWTYYNNVIYESTGGLSFDKTFSADGTISSAHDGGGTINYSYFPDGKVKTISAPGGIVTQMQYDIAGNQTQLNDPSAGIINYIYNGFGELLSQQNARLQTTTITYNSNGTIATKIYPEGTPITFTYSYNSNKQLTGITSTTGVNRGFGYDTKGRISSVTETIPGSSNFVTSYSYDSYGRLSSTTHPSLIVETRNYNSNGYLSSVSAGGSTRWTTSAMNALQQVTSGQYGSNLSVTFGYNSYGYPTSTVAGTIQNYSYNFNSATGNLNWRQNNKYTGLKEDFYYDGLDRLDYIMKGTTTTLDMAYHYDKGGIFTKSDVGSFLYNNSTKPYALSEISPTSMIIPNSVDSLTYTSFESVKTIQEDPYSATFVYNVDNARAKMEVKQNTTTILTRWYPESSYIKETTSSATKEYTFIGGDPYTAPVVAITQSGTTTYYNLLRDHLGSITHVVNASTNTLVYQYSYDAWGRMRNVSTWNNYNPGSEPALFIAGRGFTGHEHLPWFNLINMNGRMYDPIAGQFLSPDPFLQNPYLTQNLNRYSYCLNNPLKYVDPSGFERKRYEMIKIPSTYIKYFLDALGAGGLDDALSNTPHLSEGCYYDDSTGKFEFWLDGGAGNSAATTTLTSLGYLITESAEIYSTKITLNFSSSQFQKFFGNNSGDLNYGLSAQSGGSTLSLLDGSQTQDFNGFWGGVKYFWTGGNIDGYHYNMDGKVIGLAPITGMPPSFIGGPLRKGQSAIKIGKYLFNPNYLHTVIKPQVLKGAGDFIKVVGNNPDIGLKGTQIILNGAKNGPYAGKTFETGMSIIDFIF